MSCKESKEKKEANSTCLPNRFYAASQPPSVTCHRTLISALSLGGTSLRSALLLSQTLCSTHLQEQDHQHPTLLGMAGEKHLLLDNNDGPQDKGSRFG